MSMIAFRKWTILIHRYLGIALSALFLLWFLSGIGMVFGGMPELSTRDRLDRLGSLDLSKVTISAADAARGRPVDQVTISSVVGRPIYRFDDGRVVFADTGEELDPDGLDTAAIAAAFLGQPREALDRARVLTSADQWTLGLRRSLPLHAFVVNDAARTEVYVSPARAEVVLVTTARSRALAWVSAIPHWLYFRALRAQDALWRDVILWASGLGSLAAALGLVLAVLQFSPRRPFRVREITTYNPYAGLMRWHYVSGVLFGGFALTWVFSGLLSMQPGDWAADYLNPEPIERALHGGRLDLSHFPLQDSTAWARALAGRSVKELELVQVQGRATYRFEDAGARVLLSAASLVESRDAIPSETIALAARDASPAEVETLTDYDEYYYSRDRSAVLPVVRLKLSDPARTWFYVDPISGDVVAAVGRRGRLERWIYHGLHSLDFSFWYYNRPLWTMGIVCLSLGGTILSAIGVVIGVKRVRRWVRPIRQVPRT